jgi:hypothetical protein
MCFYQVYLRGGITGGVEVAEGRIIDGSAPVMDKSVGLRFAVFRDWVKEKGGELVAVKNRPSDIPACREKFSWKSEAEEFRRSHIHAL